MSNDFHADDADDWDASEYAGQAQFMPAPTPGAPAAQPARARAPLPEPMPMATPTGGARAEGDLPSPGFPALHKRSPKNFPGFIARSAMFRASSSHEPFDRPTTVKAQGCALTLSGPRLGMRDKHVWETAIQVAKERAEHIGDAFEIELRDFARRMGSSNHGGRALASIWDSLERIALARVEFEIGACKGIGSLLATASRSDGRIHLRLNPDFAMPALLGDKQFRFDQARRAALPTALAQWLHDFFSTHKLSRDMDLKYLRDLCGYDGSPRNFPGKLRAAMQSLVEAAPCLVVSFQVDEGARSSDSWKLRVELGSEKPSFLPATTVAPPPKGESGRGRVAL